MRRALIALAFAAGCASVPRVRVAHGPGDAVLPLVHTSTDPGRWYVQIDSPELGPRLYFFDTGYSMSTCDDGFAAELRLDPRGRVLVRGEAGNLHAHRGRVPAFSVGPHRVDQLACVVRDLGTTSSIVDPPEVPVAGVLGADLLRKFHVVVDPAAATVTLGPPRGRLRRSDDGVVRLHREYRVGTRFTVPVDLDGRRIRPIVDTGAQGSHLDGERLGLEPIGPRRRVTVRASGRDGRATRDIVSYRVDRIQLGATEAGPLVVTGRPRGPAAPGLLGLDILGGVRQEYDFRRHLARFTAQPPAPIPAWSMPPPRPDREATATP